MEKEGTINIIEQVKFMIRSNNYNIHDCEQHLEQLTQTCNNVLSYYNRALDKKNIATQELYNFRGRLEDKNLKVTMSESDLKQEKDARFLNENQLGVTFNQ